MTWTTPLTAVSGNVLSAAQWNQIRDDLLFLYTPPQCRIYLRANQFSITPSTWSVVSFDAERYDTDTMHSPSSNIDRITFNTAGFYLVGSGIEFFADQAGVLTASMCVFTGTSYIGGTGRRPRGDGANGDLNFTTGYVFAAADWVNFQVFNSGAVGHTNIWGVPRTSAEAWANWVSN